MSVSLHPFQSNAITRTIDARRAEASEYHLLASPTGTGKSYIAREIQRQLEDDNCWIVTPSNEVILGMMQKFYGCDLQHESLDKIINRGIASRITTPLKFHNQCVKGLLDTSEIRSIIFDEGHHDEADTYTRIRAMLNPDTFKVATTATPYRGTLKGTSDFLGRWGQPQWAISYRAAFNEGYISLPSFETIPLIDDDLIELDAKGDFVISQMVKEVDDKCGHALLETKNRGWWKTDGKPVKPTLIGVPSSRCMPNLMNEASIRGVRVECITDETSTSLRQRLFRMCLSCDLAVCHINVIGEGVDLAIRHYLDLAPTMSPVRQMQRWGRTMRPGGVSQWISCNRNIVRHAYLLDGCLPNATIAANQKVWPESSNRHKTRVMGIQSLGRLKANGVRLSNGIQCSFYCVTSVKGLEVTDYVVLLHPRWHAPIWFTRDVTKTDEEYEVAPGVMARKKIYGKWGRIQQPPEDLQGFKSITIQAGLSERQVNWWVKDAERFGLDPKQKLDTRVFQLLPVLSDNQLKLD